MALSLTQYRWITSDFSGIATVSSSEIDAVFGERKTLELTFENPNSFSGTIDFDLGLFVATGATPPTLPAYQYTATGTLPTTNEPLSVNSQSLQEQNGAAFIRFPDAQTAIITIQDVTFNADLLAWNVGNVVDNQNRLTAGSTNDIAVLADNFNSAWSNSGRRVGVSIRVQESQSVAAPPGVPDDNPEKQILKYVPASSDSPSIYDVLGRQYGQASAGIDLTSAWPTGTWVIYAIETTCPYLKIGVRENGVEIIHTSHAGNFTSTDPDEPYSPLPPGSTSPVISSPDADYMIGGVFPGAITNNFSAVNTAIGGNLLNLDANGLPLPGSVLSGFDQAFAFQTDSTANYETTVLADKIGRWRYVVFIVEESTVATTPPPQTTTQPVRATQYLPINPVFLNSARMQNPSFTGSLRTFGTNDVVLQIENSVAVQEARAYLIKYSSFANTGTFQDSLVVRYDVLPVPSNPAPTVYRTNFSIPGSEVIDGETYYILAVYKDEDGEIASYLSDAFIATSQIDTLLDPDWKIEFYRDIAYSEHIAISPLNRVRLTVSEEAAKMANVTEVIFDIPNIGRAVAVNNSSGWSVSPIFVNNEIQPYLEITTGADVELSLVIRVPAQWADTVQDVNVTFLLPDAEFNEQIGRFRLEVEQFEDLRSAPQVLKGMIAADNIVPASAFCQNLNPVTVEPTSVGWTDYSLFSIDSLVSDTLFQAGDAVRTTNLNTGASASTGYRVDFAAVTINRVVIYYKDLTDDARFALILVGGSTPQILYNSTSGEWTFAGQPYAATNEGGGVFSVSIPVSGDVEGWVMTIGATSLVVTLNGQTAVFGVQFLDNSSYGGRYVPTFGSAVFEICNPISEFTTCSVASQAQIITEKIPETDYTHYVVHRSRQTSELLEDERFTVAPLPQITQSGVLSNDSLFDDNLAQHTVTAGWLQNIEEVAVIAYPDCEAEITSLEPAVLGTDSITITAIGVGSIFRFQLSQTADFSVIDEDVAQAGNSYTFSGLLECTNYYVRVRAEDCGGAEVSGWLSYSSRKETSLYFWGENTGTLDVTFEEKITNLELINFQNWATGILLSYNSGAPTTLANIESQIQAGTVPYTLNFAISGYNAPPGFELEEAVITFAYDTSTDYVRVNCLEQEIYIIQNSNNQGIKKDFAFQLTQQAEILGIEYVSSGIATDFYASVLDTNSPDDLVVFDLTSIAAINAAIDIATFPCIVRIHSVLPSGTNSDIVKIRLKYE